MFERFAGALLGYMGRLQCSEVPTLTTLGDIGRFLNLSCDAESGISLLKTAHPEP